MDTPDRPRFSHPPSGGWEQDAGKRIKARRKELDVSSRELCRRTGLTFTQLGSIESGCNHHDFHPTLATWWTLCNALSMRLSDLWDD